jgi:hypothetical protein
MWPMDEYDWLADRFEEYRTHLRAVAYRMLGSLSEADDAIQEGWLRLSGSNTSDVEAVLLVGSNQGSSCRRRASSSLRRVSSFSASSSPSRAASHSARVPVL